jgi:hypothetical protein
LAEVRIVAAEDGEPDTFLNLVRPLFRDYPQGLQVDLAFQDF